MKRVEEKIDLIAVWKKGQLEELLAKDWSKVKKNDLPIPFQRLMKFVEEIRDGELRDLRIDGNGNPVSCEYQGKLIYFQDVN